jgi:hypothetical protein
MTYASSVLAGSDVPAFEDCQIAVTTFQKKAHLKLKLSTHESLQYASMLRTSAKQPVNFAGHYILASWGCGVSCIMGGAIDIKSGHVAMLPFTVTNWPLNITEPLSYKKDSCLLVVHGSRDEKDQGIYYYRFEDDKFNFIKATNE